MSDERQIEEQIMRDLADLPDETLMEALVRRHDHVIFIINRRPPVADDIETGLSVYLPDLSKDTVDEAYRLLQAAQDFTVQQQQSGGYNDG